MDQIVVKQDARELGIVNPVGCVIRGLDVQMGAPELDEDATAIEKTIKKDPGTILDRREVKEFHEFFSEIGYPNQTPSGEQLVRLIEKKGSTDVTTSLMRTISLVPNSAQASECTILRLSRET